MVTVEVVAGGPAAWQVFTVILANVTLGVVYAGAAASKDSGSAAPLVASGSVTPASKPVSPLIFMFVSTVKALFWATGASLTALTVIVNDSVVGPEELSPPLAVPPLSSRW